MSDPFEEWLAKQQTEHPFGAVKPEWATQLIQLGASWDTFRPGRGFEVIVKELMECSDIPLLAARDIVRLVQEELKRSEAPMAVFWELKEEMPTVETIRRLNTVLGPYGKLVQCRCYGHPATMTAHQRAALQLAGCIVMDTVSTTNNDEGEEQQPQESNAVMITVDAMQFAHEHPDGAALCFVTEDADPYSYLLETLRQKSNRCWRTITITKKPPSKQQVVHKCWQTSDILRGATAPAACTTGTNSSNTSSTKTSSPPDGNNINQYPPSATQKTVSFDSQIEQTTTGYSGTEDATTADPNGDDDGPINLLEWIKSRNDGTTFNKSVVDSSVAESNNSSQNNDTLGDDYDEYDDGTDHDDLMSLLTQEEFDYPYHHHNRGGEGEGESSTLADDEEYGEADPGNETWKTDIGYLKALIKRYSKSPLFAVQKTHVIGMLRLRNPDRFPRKRLLAVLERAIELGILAETEYEESTEEGIVQLISLPGAKSSIARPPLKPVDTIPPEILKAGIPYRVVNMSSSMPFTLLAPKRSFRSGTIIPKGVFVVNVKEWLFLMFRTRSDAQRTVDEDLPKVFGSSVLIDWRQHPDALAACKKSNSKGEEENDERRSNSREHRKNNDKQGKGQTVAKESANTHQGKGGKQGILSDNLNSKSNTGEFVDEKKDDNSSSTQQSAIILVADNDNAATAASGTKESAHRRNPVNGVGQQQRGQRERPRSRGQSNSPTQGDNPKLDEEDRANQLTCGPPGTTSVVDEKTSVDHEKAEDVDIVENDQIEVIDTAVVDDQKKGNTGTSQEKGGIGNASKAANGGTQFGGLTLLINKKKGLATLDKEKDDETDDKKKDLATLDENDKKDDALYDVDTGVTENSDDMKAEDEEEEDRNAGGQQGGMPGGGMQQGPPQQPPILREGALIASALASATPEEQRNIIGGYLYPLIHQSRPELAGKITGMLLEMDISDLLHLLESPEALNAKISETLQVLQAHQVVQKNMIEERLYPLIHQSQPALAAKITGMLLQMDLSDLLHLLESPEALNAKIAEALQVLNAYLLKSPEALTAKISGGLKADQDEDQDDWEDVEEDANCGRCGTTLLESDIIFAPKETSTRGTGRDITCIECYPWKGDEEKLQSTSRVVSLLIMMAEYDDIYVESETLKKHIHRGFPGYCTTVKHAELWISQAVKSGKVALFDHKQLVGTFFCLADNLSFANRDFPLDHFKTTREENHIKNLLVKANSPICRKDAILSLAAKFPSMQTPFLRSRVFANGEQKGKFFLVKDSFNQAIGFTEHEARAFLTKMKRTHLATSGA